MRPSMSKDFDIFDDVAVKEEVVVVENSVKEAKSAPRRTPVGRRWLPWAVVALILLGLVCAFSPLVIVRAGHNGVATFFGATRGDLYMPGVHVKYPLLRVHQFDMRTQTRDVSTSVVTKDMQTVTVNVTVAYRFDEANLEELYREVGRDAQDELLDPAAHEAVNVAALTLTAEELLTKRADLKATIIAELEPRVANGGYIIEGVTVTEVIFSDRLQEAFETTEVARQRAATAEFNAQAEALEKQD